MSSAPSGNSSEAEVTTVEFLLQEPSSHDLTSPPWMQDEVDWLEDEQPPACLGAEEVARNEIANFVEDMALNTYERMICDETPIEFEDIVSIVNSVASDAGADLVLVASEHIASDVADILECEAGGAASTKEEVCATISEVVTEAIIHPENIQRALDQEAADDQCAADEAQMNRHMTDLEDIITNSQTGATAEIVVNESKTVSTMERNHMGQVVPTALVGTVSTTSTTIEPVGEREGEGGYLDESVLPCLDNVGFGNRDYNLFDEPEPNFYHDLPMRGEILDIEEDPEYQLRMSINQVLAAGSRSMSHDHVCEDDVLSDVQDQYNPICFDDYADADFLDDEECELEHDLPSIPGGMRVDELYDEIPCDEFAAAMVYDYLFGAGGEQLLHSCNFYERRLYMIIKNRKDEIERQARCAGTCPDSEYIVTRVTQMVLEELDELRYDQAVNQRVAQGCPLYGPDNYTEWDRFGPHPLHMVPHVMSETESECIRRESLGRREQLNRVPSCDRLAPPPAEVPKKTLKTVEKVTKKVAVKKLTPREEAAARIAVSRRQAAQEARERLEAQAAARAGGRPKVARQPAGGAGAARPKAGRQAAAAAPNQNARPKAGGRAAAGGQRNAGGQGNAAGRQVAGVVAGGARPKAGGRQVAANDAAQRGGARPVNRGQNVAAQGQGAGQRGNAGQVQAVGRPVQAAAAGGRRPNGPVRAVAGDGGPNEDRGVRRNNYPPGMAIRGGGGGAVVRAVAGDGGPNEDRNIPRPPSPRIGGACGAPAYQQNNNAGGAIRRPAGAVVRAVAGDGGPNEDRNIPRPTSPRVGGLRPPQQQNVVVRRAVGPVVRAVAGDGGPDEDRNVARPPSPRIGGLRPPQQYANAGPLQRGLQAPKVLRQPAVALPADLAGVYGAMNALNQNAGRLQAGQQGQNRFGYGGGGGCRVQGQRR